MSPILGIFASQGRVASTSYESIATVTVGAGGSSSIDFTSIPSTYKHLQIRGIVRSAVAADYGYLYMRAGNGSVDTGTNYSFHVIYGNGATVTGTGAATQNVMQPGYFIPGGINQSGTFATVVIDVLDYANTNKYKTVRSLGGFDDNNYASGTNAKGQSYLTSGLWQSTSAINTIKLFADTNNNVAQYTQFALYGIKGA